MAANGKGRTLVGVLLMVLGGVIWHFYDFVMDQRSADLSLIYAELNADRAFQKEAEKRDAEIDRKLTVLDYKVNELLEWKKEKTKGKPGTSGSSASP